MTNSKPRSLSLSQMTGRAAMVGVGRLRWLLQHDGAALVLDLIGYSIDDLLGRRPGPVVGIGKAATVDDQTRGALDDAGASDCWRNFRDV